MEANPTEKSGKRLSDPEDQQGKKSPLNDLRL